MLEGRRNKGDKSDELHFGTVFLATPLVIPNCVNVCVRHREEKHRCMYGIKYFALV